MVFGFFPLESHILENTHLLSLLNFGPIFDLCLSEVNKFSCLTTAGAYLSHLVFEMMGDGVHVSA